MKSLWGKRALAILLGASLAGASGGFGAPAASAAGASAGPAVRIVLDGYNLPFDAAPRTERGTTLVPFRPIAEALGVSVVWDAKTKTVTAVGSGADGADAKVVLRVGQKTAQVNGSAVVLSAAPVESGGRVLIPLAFFSRQFGAAVAWDAANRTVEIKSPKRAMYVQAFYALRSYPQIDRLKTLNSAAFGWTRIDENGELVTDGRDFAWPKPDGDATPESIVRRVNGETYLMAFAVDGNRELTKMLTDETLRARSIDKLAALAKDSGFGGIMLDFEGLALKDDPLAAQKALNDYVKLLAAKAEPDGLKIALAVPPPNGSYKGYDYQTLGRLADHLVLMAYDYIRQGTPDPIGKIDEAIRLTLNAGVPKSKLLLGINLFNENEKTIVPIIGLAKRYDLKGVSFWRLGLMSEAEMAAIDASVTKEGA